MHSTDFVQVEFGRQPWLDSTRRRSAVCLDASRARAMVGNWKNREQLVYMYPQDNKTVMGDDFKSNHLNHRRYRDALVAVALFVLLPNSVFWAATSLFQVDRPYIVVDYVLSGVAFAYGRRILGAGLLAVFLLADGLVVQGLVYPVLHPLDILYLMSNLPQASWIWQVAVISLILLLALIVVLTYRLSRKTSALATLIISGLVVLAYGIQSQVDPQHSEFDRNKSSFVGSQLAFYVNTRAVMVLDTFFKDRNPLYDIDWPAEVEQWRGAGGSQPNTKILLVIVESWGVLKDTRAHDALIQPLVSMQDRFAWIRVGQTDGSPTTVEAELRYLCGLGARYLNLKPVVNGFENCLPWKLKALGYKTTALHGAPGRMYNRDEWYPRVGFDRLLFSDNSRWESRCHSFPGACDREILDSTVRTAFSGNEPYFLYWLTLNTHTPYDRRDIWMADAFNCRVHQMEDDSEVCRMSRLHAQFFRHLADTLAQAPMHGAEVFIVGDHPPPLLDRKEFSGRFVAGKVPYVHFRVR